MRRFVILSTLALVGLAAVYSAPQSKQKATPKAGAAAAPSVGNADAITEAELKTYLYFIASDQLEGRNLPSRGFDVAALYVASHLAEWGLKPGGSTEKTDGPLQPYFMPMELVAKSVNAEESKASIASPAGRGGGRGGRGGAGAAGGAGGGGFGGNARGAAGPAALEYGKDWTVAAGGRGAPPLQALDLTAPMVFAGNGYLIKKTNINPYEKVDVKGKIIVVAGLPAEIAAQQAAAGRGRGGRGGGNAAPAPAQPETAPTAPGGRGGDQPNPLGEECKDFMTPAQYGAANGALAVVTIANFQQLTAMANPNAAFGGFGGGGGRAGLNGPNYSVPKLQNPPACAVVPTVTAGLAMTNAIFQGERSAAQQIFYAAGNNAKQDSFDLNAEKKLTLKVAVKSEANHAENVVGIVEGGDPVLKNEYVVISAHLDHIGLAAPLPDGHNVNNGADDDGSGTVGLMAMARAYAEGAAKGMRPKRSIIFLWNAGEEKGLWGSQYFNEYPPFDITKVVANLNIDMIGRTKGPDFTDPDPTHQLVKPGEIFVIGPNISSDELEKTIETVNDGYHKLTLNHFYDATAPDATHDNLGPQPRGQRIFYRSDHYNFAKMGIPIAFFTTGLHPDYHRATDTPDKIDYKEMQIVSKTVAAVGWVLANQPNRPQLKATLPEQLIKDMKSAKDQGWGKTTPVLAPLPGMPK
jgi:Zn-dependent M28 family amino/carboxypeptidase